MRRTPLFAAVAVLALMTAAPASAQDDRRISDLQRQVRELRSIVFQGRDTGQPVVVKPEGPDPQVDALRTKVQDLEQTLRQITGQNEVLTHDIDETRRGAEQQRAQSVTRIQALSDRIAKLEALQQAAAANASAPPPADLGAPPAPGSSASGGRRPATEDFPVAAAPVAPSDAFADGSARLGSADYLGAQAAFEAYLAAEPNGARASEARYQIGQTLYARESYPQAARSYALALKGWPKARWAPDATVRLAASLSQAGRNPDACAALGEYERRYATGAPSAVKSRAATVRRAAACSAA